MEQVLENTEGHGATIWQMNTATGELKQLTNGKDDSSSGSCTPDGKWMVYLGKKEGSNLDYIFKIPTEGGAAVELAHGILGPPSISRDGLFFAYTRLDGQGPTAKLKFVVQSRQDSTPAHEFDAPPDSQMIDWTPDGRAVSFVRTVGSARNLYMQKLSGGAPVQLTHFESEPSFIDAYGWSRDGTKIAITCSNFNDQNIMMLTNFR